MSVMEGLRAPKMLVERLRPPEARSARCLDCGADMVGPFCAQCVRIIAYSMIAAGRVHHERTGRTIARGGGVTLLYPLPAWPASALPSSSRH